MTRKIDVDRMRVASPCHTGWDSMTGDDRARLCGSCDRHVYNIVGLSRGEIESLVENTVGRLCVRMYQRHDATVLTQDCPVGLRLIRRRVATFAGAALSTLLGLVSVGYGQKQDPCSHPRPVPERTKIASKNGQIEGQIVDMAGAVVPGTQVKLKLGKRLVTKIKSDSEGIFMIRDVKPAAEYQLNFDGPTGFKKLIIDQIVVDPGERVTFNVCLEVGNIEVVVGLYSAEPEPLTVEPTKPSDKITPQKPFRYRPGVRFSSTRLPLKKSG